MIPKVGGVVEGLEGEEKEERLPMMATGLVMNKGDRWVLLRVGGVIQWAC